MHPAANTSEPAGTGRLAYLPVSLFGSCMALCGLALAWRLAATEFGLPAWIGEALGLVAAGDFVALALAYGIKCVASPAAVRAEFTHPVTANFFATPLISLLLLPAVAMPYAATLARALGLIGTVAMAAFAWLIVSRWTSVRHQATHATPGWMLPVVGLLNISIGGAGLQLPGTQGVATFALSVGLFFTIPLFALILSRLIFEEPLPPPQQPSLMILMAPFAVGFLAYLAVTDHLDLYASSLFYLAVFMFAVLVPKLIRARSASSFHASWWAVSFPLAAMTLAALKFAVRQPSWAATAFALAMLAFATLVVLSLTLRTVAGIARGQLRALTV